MHANKLSPAAETAGSLDSLQTNLPQRILVVDRDPYVRHLSADALIQQGFEVNAAEDGAAGWEELQANDYHLLITEHDLPKISGVQLVKKVRAAHLSVSVVMIASKLPARGPARSPSLQLAATLLKPLPMASLVDTVKIILRAAPPRADHAATQPARTDDSGGLTVNARRVIKQRSQTPPERSAEAG